MQTATISVAVFFHSISSQPPLRRLPARGNLFKGLWASLRTQLGLATSVNALDPSAAFPDDPLKGPELHQRLERASSSISSSTVSSFADNPHSSPRRTVFAGASADTSHQTRRNPRPIASHISSNYSAAILYALEEALRHPNPFTPDIVEENASMSDLTGGGALGSAYGRAANNGGAKAQSGPVPVGSPSNAAGIKGPREIMRERTAREAQRRADQEAKEALEQRRAEDEQKLLDLENRKAAERRALAAGATGARKGSATGAGPAPGASEQFRGGEIRGGTTNINNPSGYSAMPTSQARGTGRTATAGEPAGSSRPSREPPVSQSRQTRPQEVPKGSSSVRPEPGHAVPPSGSTVPQPETASSSKRATRTSFPHAFERWETLSAHWEGLTSYWVRRLEENNTELSREPLSQQMSRQVTDLSAAGANLFHAVVELQRLRASSERKFQRWFFETRQQEEKAQEQIAILEKTLQDERNGRSKAIEDAVNVAVAAEKENTNSQKLISEMKRELGIAREEARRAWEELGRREQEERERTISLRDGQPTLVGGVQVVPMMQGVTSRHSSARPPTRDGPPSGSDRPMSGPGSQHQYSRAQESPADPFTESSKPGNPSASYAQYPTASVSHPTSYTAPFYPQHQGHSEDPTGREQHDRSYGTSEPFSEEEYVIDSEGQYRRDDQGNKIRFHAAGPASDGAREDTQHGQVRRNQYDQALSGVEYGQGALPPSGRVAAPAIDDAYSGAGYGTGWEDVTTHHHPTRLSDVLEEDERSRTSASQLSRG